MLDARLEQLGHAPFFREGLKDYLDDIRNVIEAIQQNFAALPPQVSQGLTKQVWSATRYLTGSVSREIPYEVVFGLEAALGDWMPKQPPHLVTTAFLSNLNFHFEGVPEDFYVLADTYFGVTFKQRLVQIALPQLYKHLPLHNCVLYHELGHFVDQQYGISSFMAFHQIAAGASGAQVLPYCREHFADLFAACYAGEGIARMLEGIAGGMLPSVSHPGTDDRAASIRNLIQGRTDPTIESCNTALSTIGLPSLSVRFKLPSLAASFDNIRPHKIESIDELHGILPAGLEYLENRLANLTGAYEHTSEGDATRIVNDLVEKSIRNWMIAERWSHVSSMQA